MKKFLKLYWSFIISCIFFFVYGIVLGTIYYSDAFVQNNKFGLFFVLMVLLLVVVIFSEMIYFMIKAYKNKKLKNRLLWLAALYFFNVFIFPYFYLKYICGEKKITKKMIIFAILGLTLLGLGWVFNASFDEGYIDNKPLIIVEDDVKLKVDSGFRETEIGEYDIYLKDRRRQINVGGFIYDEDDNDTPEDILLARDLWLKTSRGPVTILDTIKNETEDSFITTVIYIGYNDNIRNMYYVSTVEFKNTDCFVNTIITYLHDDYLDYKNEIIQILKDMEYVEDSEL